MSRNGILPRDSIKRIDVIFYHFIKVLINRFKEYISHFLGTSALFPLVKIQLLFDKRSLFVTFINLTFIIPNLNRHSLAIE